MDKDRLRAGDVVIAIYLLFAAAHVFATALFIATGLGGFGDHRNVGMLFGSVFSLYIGTSVCLAAWLYRDVLLQRDGRDSVLWLLGFVLFGAITIPIYYFSRRKKLRDQAARTDQFERLARALVAALLVVACVRMGWVLAIALAHLPITSAYRWVASADRTLTWAAWVATLVVLIRRPWPFWKKVGWGAASLIGMFLIMPVLHFAYPQNPESAPPNSTQQLTRPVAGPALPRLALRS